MSTPERIDVLALLDSCIEYGIPQECPELQRASAAIAELIEATKRAVSTWPHTADICGLRTALTRVTGEQA